MGSMGYQNLGIFKRGRQEICMRRKRQDEQDSKHRIGPVKD